MSAICTDIATDQ